MNKLTTITLCLLAIPQSVLPGAESSSAPETAMSAAKSVSITIPEDLLARAQAGEAEAQFKLGELHDPPDNSGSEENARIALGWYEKAAAQGYPKAAEYAGYVILNGLAGKEIDHARALNLLRPVAESGVDWACIQLGMSYLRGQGVPPSGREALAWFLPAAERGAAEAMFRAGYIHAKGIDVPRDQQKAVEWFKKAAEAKSSPARACLGAMAWAGEGLPRDYAEAERWFRSALEAPGGNTWAPYMLGLMRENGQGAPADLSAAIELYQKAAAGGYYQATIRCALLKAAGLAPHLPDYQPDPKWLRKGAEAGNPADQFILGLALHQGWEGLPRDDAEALLWLTLADGYEMSAATNLAAQLRRELPPETVRQTEERADEFRRQFATSGRNLF